MDINRSPERHAPLLWLRQNRGVPDGAGGADAGFWGSKAGAMARKGRARRFREARELKQGFDDGLFAESGRSLADVDLDGKVEDEDEEEEKEDAWADEWDDDPLDDDDPLREDDRRAAS